jgi:hypothetical protein
LDLDLDMDLDCIKATAAGHFCFLFSIAAFKTLEADIPLPEAVP